jgi:cytochrome c peroxidase
MLLYSFISKRHAPEDYTFTYPAYFGNRINVPADNPTTKQGVYLGRVLFYEQKLSTNNTISCGSCHKQQYAFTDPHPFSRGFDGTPTKRNVMSLQNLLWVRNFFWDGRAGSLEQQAAVPLTDMHEMGQPLILSAQKLQQTKNYPALFNAAFGSDTITPDRIVKALSQFERTLISAGSAYDRYLNGKYKPTSQELNGMALFFNEPEPNGDSRGAGCGHCHGGPKIFNELYENNGLDSLPADAGRENITGMQMDFGRFRVVTLRNIALTAPYMHDGRFNTLEEVLEHYNSHVQASPTLSPFVRNNSNQLHGKSLMLTGTEMRDIVAFLHMLTDSAFVNNPQFANPFLTNNNKQPQ